MIWNRNEVAPYWRPVTAKSNVTLKQAVRQVV